MIHTSSSITVHCSAVPVVGSRFPTTFRWFHLSRFILSTLVGFSIALMFLCRKSRRAPTLASLAICCCYTNQSHAEYIIDFDALATPPAINSFKKGLASANNGSSLIGNVVFNTGFSVVGSEYVEQFKNQGGSNPFAIPHSGNFAIFNNNGDDELLLETSDVLTGVWIGRPDMGIGPRGTNQVSVRAMDGPTVLATETIVLTDSTPMFLDTSSFLNLSGTSGYRFDRVATNSDGYGGVRWS